MHEDFKSFLNFFLIFVFVSLFWGGFKADMAKRNSTSNVAQIKTSTVKTLRTVQKTYRQVYVNNNYGGPATVYYVRQ